MIVQKIQSEKKDALKSQKKNKTKMQGENDNKKRNEKRSEMKTLVQMRGEKKATRVTSANDDGPRSERSCYAYEYYEH